MGLDSLFQFMFQLLLIVLGELGLGLLHLCVLSA
jgi:hypothetical protein